MDELAVHRLAAPPDVVKKQLYHLAAVVNAEPKTTLRVLPVRARITDFTVPRCTFSMYTYPDPGDPQVVAIDTVTSDSSGRRWSTAAWRSAPERVLGRQVAG
jgi:hypothetical protein